jgi:predicted RNase H-like HicB family nuclease
MREYEIFIWEEVEADLPMVAFAPDPGVWARGGTIDEVMQHIRMEIECSNDEYGSLGNPDIIVERLFVHDEMAV